MNSLEGDKDEETPQNVKLLASEYGNLSSVLKTNYFNYTVFSEPKPAKKKVSLFSFVCFSCLFKFRCTFYCFLPVFMTLRT